MNRTELIDRIADGAGFTKADAGRALDAVITAITDELEAGGEVRLLDFGIITVTETGAREGRNPQTGEKIKIAAKRRARFKEAKALKERLNQPVRMVGARRVA